MLAPSGMLIVPLTRSVSDVSRLSANVAVATLNVGSVGGAMGLSFWDCFIVILVVNLVLHDPSLDCRVWSDRATDDFLLVSIVQPPGN